MTMNTVLNASNTSHSLQYSCQKNYTQKTLKLNRVHRILIYDKKAFSLNNRINLQYLKLKSDITFNHHYVLKKIWK